MAKKAAKNLVIVESPAKAKTIGKYLGPDYEVMASMGHLRDLPKSKIGVDVDNDFHLDYKPIKGKEDIIRSLKKAADAADMVYLATDPDREGEAISWHLKYLLDLPDEKTRRVTFNEITKKVVQESIAAPRRIDQELVDAQQARRVLDRIVGYRLSPLLWKKIRRGLSAGRVQSVAMRLVAEREKEIENFVPQETWNVNKSEESKKAGNFGEAEEAMAKAGSILPQSKKGKELTAAEDEKKVDALAAAALGSEKNDIQKKEQKKVEIRKKPYSIEPVNYPKMVLFDTVHLLNNTIIKLNVNHPFYKNVLQPLCGDLSEPEANQERQNIKNAILLLLFAYAKAESMFENHEAVFDNLRSQWGSALATALSEYDREVHS